LQNCHNKSLAVLDTARMGSEAELRPGQPVGPAVLALAREFLRHLAFAEEKADAEAIHDFRRAAKRWRAFLRLVEPYAGSSAVALRQQVRDIALDLASARDAQAALDALADLRGEYATLSPRSLTTVTDRLETLRASAEQATLTTPIRDRLAQLQGHSLAALEQWGLDRLTFHDIAASLRRGYRRARKSMPADWSAATAEELHELRSRVVVHRYQMEMVEPLWPRLGKVWVGEAQRLRERLGHYQDLAVLRRLVSARQPLARWNKLLTPAIESRQRDHIEAAMRQARRLFAERPHDFQRRLESIWDGP
jgi:CHAD domain-containing protein